MDAGRGERYALNMQDRTRQPVNNSLGDVPVPHYYGDTVRSIFFVLGAALLIMAAFIGAVSPLAMPLAVLFAVTLVLLAAFTSPRAKGIHTANVACAALGTLAAEAFAVGAFSVGSFGLFILGECIAVAFLAALYFAAKTMRAIAMHQLGRRDVVGDFLNDEKE